MTWTDIKDFKAHWKILEELQGGGQGYAYKAERLSDQHIGFLKTLKHWNVAERRGRFFREATQYSTLGFQGVPSLIESNAQHHDDDEYKLYIASTFIQGPTLRAWREHNTLVPLEVGISITRCLLGLLEKCHTANCIHRDIKPDNLILRSSDPVDIVLLDFGLSFSQHLQSTFQTEVGEEVGNRFLRLPELSPGSATKQDTRSDLTFVAGIFFYLLTGESPNVLQDEGSRLPHQRATQSIKLRQTAGSHFSKLAAFFDNAFAPRIAERYSSSQIMLQSLDKITVAPTIGKSADENLQAILTTVDTDAERRSAVLKDRFWKALIAVGNAVEKVSTSAKLSTNQTGLVLGNTGTNTYYWFRRGGSSPRFLSTTFTVSEIGDEIVIQISGDTIYRTSSAEPIYRDAFNQAIRENLLARLADALNNPNALPPESEYFREVAPYPLLSQAAEQAQRLRSFVIAFVYDPDTSERSRLQYALSTFLQNRNTRDMLNATFAIALVPLAQVAVQSNILHGKSMEDARWVVFDEHLNVLEEAVVYQNPQEGEKIARRLSDKYKR